MLLYETIADALATQINRGGFTPGDRLPSLRRVSVQNRISVATAAQAYVTLEQRGLIEARPKSGFYVRAPSWSELAQIRPSRPAPRATKVTLGELHAELIECSTDPEIVPLGAAMPSVELFPVLKLNRLAAAAARRAGGAAIAYPPLTGCAALLRQLSRRSLEWQCRLAPDELIVTNGASEALMLPRRRVDPDTTTTKTRHWVFGI